MSEKSKGQPETLKERLKKRLTKEAGSDYYGNAEIGLEDNFGMKGVFTIIDEEFEGLVAQIEKLKDFPNCQDCDFRATGGGKCRALRDDVCPKDKFVEDLVTQNEDEGKI